MAPLTNRIAGLLLSVWALVTVSFVCLYVLPGDPARMILGAQASAESVSQFRSEYGLDQPLPAQYVGYLVRLSHLDLGYSLSHGRPVVDLLLERGSVSVSLAACALIVAVLLGIFLPTLFCILGWKKGNVAYSVVLQTLAFTPGYLFALTSLVFVAGWLQLAPVIFDQRSLASWILAAAVLSIYPTALLLRVVLQGLRRELAAPYVRRATASGLGRAAVVLREALPNVLPAPLASLANATAFFFTSAFFVETALGVPGLGRLAQDAVRQKDVTTLSGVCLAYCAMVALTSIVLNLVLSGVRRRSATV